MCHAVYGAGDCIEFDFCGAQHGRGVCFKGLCICYPGFGGTSCEYQARCHFWDESISNWSQEGMTTLPSSVPMQDGSISNVIGQNGYVRCIAEELSVNQTEYAAVWTPVDAAGPPPPPSPPPPAYKPTLLEIDANPVFYAVIVILLFNIASIFAGNSMLRSSFPNGILGKEKDEEPKPAATPKEAAARQAATGAASRALMGPREAEAKVMPKLAARFEVEAKMEGFDENAFTRRLATLVGVESIDPKAVSLNKYTANPDTFAIDVEIACPDATTLVMAAKTLKKAAGPLGLALGVKLVDSPNVTVPEPEAPSRGAPPESRGDSPPAQRSAATIQERIVMAPPGGKPAAQRRITLEKGPAAGGPLALMAPGAPASSLGALDWQFGGIGGKVAAGVGQMAGAMNPAGFMTGPPPPARPDGGIQERISLGGMARPSRGTASLRQRALAGAARIDPMAPAAGVLGGAGAVLNQAFKDERAASRARSAQMSASQRARFEERGLLGQIGIGGSAEPRDQIIGRPGATDGIQERLPAMPGMRNRQNRRAAGEPRLKAAGAVAEALQRMPPAASPVNGAEAGAGVGISAAPGAAPIQERVPRISRGASSIPTPPPSPPASVMPSPSKASGASSPKPGAGAIVPRTQVAGRIIPKNGVEVVEDEDEEISWDDRSVREILWGIAREHTLIGCITAFLFGDGPKLATVPQAAQLLHGALLGLLFLSCAQLRYTWLGATWAGTPPAYNLGIDDIPLYDRLPFLSAVGVAAALVGWPCVLVTRWLFLLANRTYPSADREQKLLMFGSAWGIVVLTCGALAIGAVNMSSNMDAAIVRSDVFVSWGLALVVQWFLYEPMMLGVFALINLLLKWCTSFEDLPEVKAEMLKQQKEEFLASKAAKAELMQKSKLTEPRATPPISELEGPTTAKLPNKADLMKAYKQG